MNELDSQAKAILDLFHGESAKQSPSDPTPTAGERIAMARLQMRNFISLSGVPEPVLKVEDINIPGPAGNIAARLYIPRTGVPMPALVYYHGGGFVTGDLDFFDASCRALANRAECLVVSVAYRLAPEDPYPAAVDDAWAALQWIADHASEVGVDRKRLAVGGDSAGGSLAAWVAQKAKQQGLPLCLQVLFYPSLDATTSSASWRELGTGAYIIKHDEMIERYNAYLPKGTDRKDPSVSPLHAADLTGLAPALIVTAEYDPLRDEGDEYAARLQAANVPVEHTCWPGMIHGFLSMAGVIDAGKLLIDQAGKALRGAFEVTAKV